MFLKENHQRKKDESHKVSHSFLSWFVGPIPDIGTETESSNQRSNSIVGNPVI
jgi:hypothetical protein